MTTNLHVDRRGHVFYGKVRLPIRYENGCLEFVVKDKRLRGEYGLHVAVSLSELARLELIRCQSLLTENEI